MDIKEKIDEIVDRVTSDKDLIEKFKKEPVKAIESVAGVDLPDDVVEKIIDIIKTKITADKVSDAFGALKKLFQDTGGRYILVATFLRLIFIRVIFMVKNMTEGTPFKLIIGFAIPVAQNFGAEKYSDMRKYIFIGQSVY